MTKLDEQQIARELRRAGMPYKRIASRIGVSASSVHGWTKDIELTAEQRAFNLCGPSGPQNPELVRRRAESWAAKCRASRLASQEDGRRAAREGNPLHHAGCMLYWAEGSKGRHAIDFTNSDPRMLVLFRRFLTDAMAIERDEILLTINVYTNNGLTIEDIERYWLELLVLPATSPRKHMTNHMPTSSSGRARNKLPYGVCTLRVHSTWMLQHIYGAIQEYAGFEEPAWLH
jgi:transposase-like protein